ncbi:MAG: serine/threonine protein kinase [Deltaproteobacteria bacterium]|nr:serine/threonine protein kinase [Deltaproteobacteria bacterium]
MPFCATCNGRFDQGTFCPKDGTALLPDGEPLRSLVGQVIGGRYRLTKLLGAGGMGEVYAAQHVHIHKRVAVKLLHGEISSNPEAVARFQQEAQSASSIGHDNIVIIDDFGTMDDGRVYLCMEFLEGVSLSEAMQEPGGMDLLRAMRVMTQVCDGLGAAHAKGIVHRDMKPENVFLTRRSDGSEVAKILDFGIAKVSGTEANQNLTKTGTVFGTPHYMSPEQALGQKVDHRADIYSVGVMLFEMFTGQVPFKAESFMGILSQHITKPPPVPSTVSPGKAIPRPIEEIILKSMAKDPTQRFGSMQEVKEALLAVSHGLAASAPAQAAYQPTRMAAAMPGSMAPTMAAPGSTGPSLPPAPVASPADSGAAIPKTVFAGGAAGSAPAMPAVPVHPPPGRPAPQPMPARAQSSSGKKSNTGLIIAIVAVVVVLGGGAAAAAIFWDKITGKTDQPIAAGTGTGTTPPATTPDAGKVASATPDAAIKVEPVAKVDPPKGEEPKGEEPKGEEPKGEEPKGEEPKPKTKKVLAKVAPKGEEPKPKKEPKPEVAEKKDPPPKPKPSITTVTLATVPSDAAVIRDGQRVGRTPMPFKLKPGESVRVMVARAGFKDQWVTVTANDEDRTMRVKLKKGFAGGALGIPGSDPGAPSGKPF